MSILFSCALAIGQLKEKHRVLSRTREVHGVGRHFGGNGEIHGHGGGVFGVKVFVY